MSEEFDDATDPNVIIVHRLLWRSQGMFLINSNVYNHVILYSYYCRIEYIFDQVG